MKKLAICSLFLFLNYCSSGSVNNKNPLQKKWIVSETDHSGTLRIDFESKEDISVKNFTLRISKKFPFTKYESRWVSASPIPIVVEMVVPTYAIVHDYDYLNKVDLRANETYEYSLPAGEYYSSIDTIDNHDFSFSPKESQQLLFTFGYKHEPIQVRSVTSKYDSECISGYTGAEEKTTWNISSCPKIVIKENQISHIKIRISELKPTSETMRFNKFIPGILLFAPITNWLGTFFYRDYLVELTNLTSPISKREDEKIKVKEKK